MMMSHQSVITEDDEEFTKCQYCQLSVQAYNNTSAISTTSTTSLYTKRLLKYHHSNCEKCGLYIEFHPKECCDESLIFVCSAAIPHKHCLCYDCGLLYDINAKRKSMGIINLLQYNKADTAAQIEVSQDSSSTSNLMPHNGAFSTSFDMVNNSSISAGSCITSIMHEIVQNNHDLDNKTNNNELNESDGTLLMGTICALLMWIGLYFNIPDIFRLTGCIIWIIIFYVLSNLYFTENCTMQRAVYSLFGFCPIFASMWIFEKTRTRNDLHNDIRAVIYFFCIAMLISYLSFYWTPLDMINFIIN
eukprot:493556_1